MRLTLGEIADCLGCRVSGQDNCEVTSVATDSRSVEKGALFICIVGERFDGHDFVSQAASNGAIAMVSQRDLPDCPLPVLVVQDSIKALGKIAAYWRKKTSAKVVAITGTAGKTTVKEALAHVLSGKGKVAKTEKNHNNQIGLPLSMLSADGDEDFWIMEVGISKAGDMDELGEILLPDVALVLNVGPGHTQGLGDGGVAWHKARLLNYLQGNGVAFINANYPELALQAGKYPCQKITFGSCDASSVDIGAKYIGRKEEGADGKGLFELRTGKDSFMCEAPFQGEYGSENVAAVVAVTRFLGLDTRSVASGLQTFTLPQQRFQLQKLAGWTVIDDSYNANPLSMERMLDSAKQIANGKKFVAVLGEMGELGDVADAMHIQLGERLSMLAPTAIIWKGGHVQQLMAGLEQGNYAGKVLSVDSVEDFERAWQSLQASLACSLSDEGCVLFKGSRMNHLEVFVTRFCEQLLAAQH